MIFRGVRWNSFEFRSLLIKHHVEDPEELCIFILNRAREGKKTLLTANTCADNRTSMWFIFRAHWNMTETREKNEESNRRNTKIKSLAQQQQLIGNNEWHTIHKYSIHISFFCSHWQRPIIKCVLLTPYGFDHRIYYNAIYCVAASDKSKPAHSHIGRCFRHHSSLMFETWHRLSAAWNVFFFFIYCNDLSTNACSRSKIMSRLDFTSKHMRQKITQSKRRKKMK